MLVTVQKLCHVPHASRITTWATIFAERLFSVSKEWVRSWSLVFLITYYKKFAEKLLAIRSKKGREGKMKKKRTRMAIAKVCALNANAIYIWSLTSIISLWMSAAFLGMSWNFCKNLPEGYKTAFTSLSKYIKWSLSRE